VKITKKAEFGDIKIIDKSLTENIKQQLMECTASKHILPIDHPGVQDLIKLLQQVFYRDENKATAYIQIMQISMNQKSWMRYMNLLLWSWVFALQYGQLQILEAKIALAEKAAANKETTVDDEDIEKTAPTAAGEVPLKTCFFRTCCGGAR
jgi:hypothetical protein